MQTRPFFADATPTVVWVMRFFVGTNTLIIALGATYLFYYFAAAGLSWPYVAAAILVGYFFADFLSGVVHWSMDTWFDERTFGRAIAIAREHHTHPHHIHGYTFLDYASLGSTPSVVFMGPALLITALFPVSAATYVLMIVWMVIALCMLFGTSFHNLAHRKARNPVLRFAQRIHLTCPPDHHWVHHGNQTIHYCVVNGWANYVCDGLYIWRGLEKMIQAVTGVVPRADDFEWQKTYQETGVLAGPQR
jgi:ubiquitin-conjugating enzyme E2 variant